MTFTRVTNASIEDVIRELSRMTRDGINSPAVKRLAEEASSSIPSIFDFVRNTFPYTPDPLDMELFIAPNRIAEDYYAGNIRGGDCDDLAMLTAALLGSIGYEVRIMLIATGGPDIDHAVAQVNTPEHGWLNMDTSSRFPLGWEIPGYRVYANP